MAEPGHALLQRPSQETEEAEIADNTGPDAKYEEELSDVVLLGVVVVVIPEHIHPDQDSDQVSKDSHETGYDTFQESMFPVLQFLPAHFSAPDNERPEEDNLHERLDPVDDILDEHVD